MYIVNDYFDFGIEFVGLGFVVVNLFDQVVEYMNLMVMFQVGMCNVMFNKVCIVGNEDGICYEMILDLLLIY